LIAIFCRGYFGIDEADMFKIATAKYLVDTIDCA